MKSTITQFDRVRVRSSAETDALAVAGLVGQVYGFTTPSVTGVEVVGTLTGDYALNVHFDGRKETLWFAPELLEFVDHAPGTRVGLGPGREWVRAESGQWVKQGAVDPENVNKDRVVIPLSRAKTARLMLGSAFMVAASIFAMTIVDQTPFPVLLGVGAGIAGALFFGAGCLWSFVKLFDRKPGLVVDTEGIIDNASLVAAGRIAWSEIKGIELREVRSQKYVAIYVEEPGKYVKRANPLWRWLANINLKYFGTPVNISATALRTDFPKLRALLEEQFAKYSQSKLPEAKTPPSPG
jgi:hypothetical protein